MAKCHALEKENQYLLKSNLVVGQQTCSPSRLPDKNMDDDVANLYTSFLSHGSVSLVGQSAKISIKLLHWCHITIILHSVLS